MKITKDKIVRFNVKDGVQSFTVLFIPESAVPGYTHKVAVQRGLDRLSHCAGWLSEGFKLDHQIVEFFLKKFLTSHPI